MRCRKCGKDNPEGSQFCGYCGEALQQDNMNLQTKMNGGEDKKEQKMYFYVATDEEFSVYSAG